MQKSKASESMQKWVDILEYLCIVSASLTNIADSALIAIFIVLLSQEFLYHFDTFCVFIRIGSLGTKKG